MTQGAGPAPEFSYVVDVDDVGRAGKKFQLSASKAERERIAARLETPSVESLEGEMTVTASRTMIRITGDIKAALTRECVASLESMTETIAEPFEVQFTRVPPEDDGAEEEDLDAPEYLDGAALDLGELLVQQLSLAMDPFPRKEGAESLAEAYAPAENVSPFAVLKGRVGKSDDNQ
ncbi:YceD family protein [Hyphococcus sp.]|uniref:YceD family protein n=1 Tax=Hyphococcus sp. TaxID=2038636 RepID=UPI0035C745AB